MIDMIREISKAVSLERVKVTITDFHFQHFCLFISSWFCCSFFIHLDNFHWWVGSSLAKSHISCQLGADEHQEEGDRGEGHHGGGGGRCLRLVRIASVNSWHRGCHKCALRCAAVPSFAIYASQRHRTGKDMVEGAEKRGDCALVRKLHRSRGRCRGSRTTGHQADWHLLAPRPRDLDNSTGCHESVAIVDDWVGALRRLFWQNKLLHARTVQVPHLTLVALVHCIGTAGEKDGRQGEQIGGG